VRRTASTLTLIEGETSILPRDKGHGKNAGRVLILACGEFTVTRMFIPKVGRVDATSLGNNTSVRFGNVLTLIMPNSMWVEYEETILAAAMGPGVT